MLLNRAQARAAYDAMCALNNVTTADGIRLSFIGVIEGGESHRIDVIEIDGKRLRVSCFHSHGEDEYFDDQSAFADAYGLNGALKQSWSPVFVADAKKAAQAESQSAAPQVANPWPARVHVLETDEALQGFAAEAMPVDGLHPHFSATEARDWCEIASEGQRVLGVMIDTEIEEHSPAAVVLSAVAAQSSQGAMQAMAAALGINWMALLLALAPWTEGTIEEIHGRAAPAVGFEGLRDQVAQEESAVAARKLCAAPAA